MIEKTLQRIQSRIQSAAHLGDDERTELLKLIDELGHEIEDEHPPQYLTQIESALTPAEETEAQSDSSAEEDAAPLANAVDSLRDSVYEMEASHPQLAGIVNRMLHILARIGI